MDVGLETRRAFTTYNEGYMCIHDFLTSEKLKTVRAMKDGAGASTGTIETGLVFSIKRNGKGDGGNGNGNGNGHGD